MYKVHYLKDGKWIYPICYRDDHHYYIVDTDEVIDNRDIYFVEFL